MIVRADLTIDRYSENLIYFEMICRVILAMINEIDIGELQVKFNELKKSMKNYKLQIKKLSEAPTDLERRSRIEILLAEMEARPAEDWANEYIDYITINDDPFF